jgi:hypothetical protein
MAPPFYTLDPELQRLFLRAFVDGHADPSARPAPAEWRRALLDAQARLARCAANPRHLFSPHLDLCCWCHRARLLQGRDPFPATEMAAARFAAAPPVPRPRPAPGQLAHAHPYAPAPVPPQPFAPAAPAPPPLVFRATRAALSRAHAALPAWARPAFGPASLGNPLVWMPPAALTCLFGATGGLRLMGLVVFFLALRRVFSGGLPRLRFATVVWAALLLLAWSAVGGAAFAGMFPSKAPAPGVVPVVDDRPADDPVADARVSAALSPAAPGEVGTGDVAPRDVELLNSGDVAQEARSVYPPDLLAHDVSGEVRLRLLVRADGTVDARSVYVLSASDPAFTEPGRIVAGAMRFSPVTVSGRPIPAWVETTLRFTP